MSKEIEQEAELAAIPWPEAMAQLAETLRKRGHYVPAGSSLTLERVPVCERNEHGLPWYRVKVVSHGS